MISIIVPVFNTEKYLRRCLDSILGQVNDKFEVILVDDGSTDSSPEICDLYCKQDARVRTIHKKNDGPANARNTGIELAQFKYIAFIDSDDWVRADYCKKITDAIKHCPDDSIVFSHITEYVEASFCDYTTLPEQKHMATQAAIRVLDDVGNFNVIWNKIYSLNIINSEPRIRFYPHSEPGEDLIFNCDYFERIKVVSFLCDPLYHYMRQGEDSEANKYRRNLYDKNKLFISRKMLLYQKLCMNSEEDNKHLAECYASYIFCCIPNMYRQSSEISMLERIQFYKGILASVEIQRQFKNYIPKNSLMKRFLELYNAGSPYRLEITYRIQCWLRNNLKGLYQIYKKRNHI